jgi:cytochrome c biogenesis protein CcmG, thiol:disulfide interchange protein DsbE
MANDAYRRLGGGFGTLAGMACVLALAGVCPRAVAQADPLLNKPAPLFVRNDLDKHRVDLAALRGRTVLLNFWATWCGPCKIEIPRFAEWQTRYKAEGLEIVGVSMDDDAALVQSLLRKQKVNYPIVMGDEQLGLQYGGILGLPVTWLIDRKGIVRAHYKGDADLNRMEVEVRKLLNSR